MRKINDHKRSLTLVNKGISIYRKTSISIKYQFVSSNAVACLNQLSYYCIQWQYHAITMYVLFLPYYIVHHFFINSKSVMLVSLGLRYVGGSTQVPARA